MGACDRRDSVSTSVMACHIYGVTDARCRSNLAATKISFSWLGFPNPNRIAGLSLVRRLDHVLGRHNFAGDGMHAGSVASKLLPLRRRS